MRKNINILLNTALCLLTAMFSVSCLMEKEGPPVQKQNVMVEMNVTVGAMTKAVYEDATSAEKVINTLRVYAFYGERLAGHATRNATSLGEPFYMDLELPATGTHNVDFYLIANEGEMSYENGTVQLSENMTRSQLEQIKFTGLKHRTTIPMYCKQTAAVNVDNVNPAANTAEGHEGHIYLDESLTFELNRSLAKLSVFAAKATGAADTPQILTVDLLAGGTRLYSYLFNQNEAVLEAVQSRGNDRNLLTSAVAVTEEVTKGTAAADDHTNYTEVVTDAYLPEVNDGYDETSAQYRWNVSSGSDRAATLFIEYTVSSEPESKREVAYVYLPKIKRDRHYKICILINAEGQIILNYTVADWDEPDTPIPPRVIDYPTHSYIRDAIPFTETDMLAKPASPATMSLTKPFEGYFQMLYPEGDSWNPRPLGTNIGLCEVKVYEAMTNLEVTGYIPVSDKWYRIEVTPKSSFPVGEEVKLGVAYSATGMEMIDFLLVNGSYTEYYWPYEGTSIQDANYVIITMVN